MFGEGRAHVPHKRRRASRIEIRSSKVLANIKGQSQLGEIDHQNPSRHLDRNFSLDEPKRGCDWICNRSCFMKVKRL